MFYRSVSWDRMYLDGIPKHNNIYPGSVVIGCSHLLDRRGKVIYLYFFRFLSKTSLLKDRLGGEK